MASSKKGRRRGRRTRKRKENGRFGPAWWAKLRRQAREDGGRIIDGQIVPTAPDA